MKKLLILSILLSSLITVSCKTIPKNNPVLPPKPQREELPEVKTIQDMADVIKYYEFLLQEWEIWGDKASLIIGE